MGNSITINILNWNKYNPKRDQKTYTWFKLNNDFFRSQSMIGLSSCERYIFIVLLAYHSQRNSEQCTVNIRWLAQQAQVRSKEVHSCLKKLKDNNVIDFYYDNVLQNTTPRIDKNRIDKNRIDKNISSKPQAVRVEKESTDGSKVFESYRDAYFKRYGVEPVRNKTINSQAKGLAERLGVDNACEVVKFYLTHNDSFFVRDQHPLGLCLSKAEALHTQWQRGTKVTGYMANQFTKQQATNDAFDRVIKKMGDTTK